jgi:WS/DGAT/MGAT family acyltransferase
VRAQDALFLHATRPGIPQQVGARIHLADPQRREDWHEHLAALIRERAPGIDLLCRRLAPGRIPRWMLDPAPDPAVHLLREVRAVTGAATADAALTAFLREPVDPVHVGWRLQVAVDRAAGEVIVLAALHHALGDGLAITDGLATLLTDDWRLPAVPPAQPQPTTAAPPTRRRWLPPVAAPQQRPSLPTANAAPTRRPEPGQPAAAPARRPEPGLPAAAPARRQGPSQAPSPQRARSISAALPKQLPAVVRGCVGLALAGTAGRSPLTGRTSGPATVHTLRIDAARVRAIARRHGVGTTTLLLTALADALHALLADRGPNPPARVRAMVPMTARTQARTSTRAPGNRTAAMPVDLPVAAMDVRERLAVVAAALASGSRNGLPVATTATLRVLGLLPAPLQAGVVRMIYGRRFFHVLASVMPGIRRPLHVRGGPLLDLYPALPPAPGVGLAFGALQCGGRIGIGITADTALIPDHGDLPTHLAAALTRLEHG